MHLLETIAYFRENHFAGILIQTASDRLAMESSTLMVCIIIRIRIYLTTGKIDDNFFLNRLTSRSKLRH